MPKKFGKSGAYVRVDQTWHARISEPPAIDIYVDYETASELFIQWENINGLTPKMYMYGDSFQSLPEHFEFFERLSEIVPMASPDEVEAALQDMGFLDATNRENPHAGPDDAEIVRQMLAHVEEIRKLAQRLGDA
jgi:hypothetical protein